MDLLQLVCWNANYGLGTLSDSPCTAVGSVVAVGSFDSGCGTGNCSVSGVSVLLSWISSGGSQDLVTVSESVC